jgi:hypothetical protein
LQGLDVYADHKLGRRGTQSKSHAQDPKTSAGEFCVALFAMPAMQPCNSTWLWQYLIPFAVHMVGVPLLCTCPCAGAAVRH